MKKVFVALVRSAPLGLVLLNFLLTLFLCFKIMALQESIMPTSPYDKILSEVSREQLALRGEVFYKTLMLIEHARRQSVVPISSDMIVSKFGEPEFLSKSGMEFIYEMRTGGISQIASLEFNNFVLQSVGFNNRSEFNANEYISTKESSNKLK